MAKLNEGQKRFVSAALALTPQTKGLTLLGEGGTGKTTSVMAAVKSYLANGKRVLLCAPTNKAVKQMEAAARQFGLKGAVAMTLHKALGLALLPSEENKHTVKMGPSILGEFDLVVLDEGSMVSGIAVDRYLIPELHTNPHTLLIIMGDRLQLPP